jgi:hypothetical protein
MYKHNYSSITALLNLQLSPGRHSLCPWLHLPLPFTQPSILAPSQPCRPFPICPLSPIISLRPLLLLRRPHVLLRLCSARRDCSSVDGRSASPFLPSKSVCFSVFLVALNFFYLPHSLCQRFLQRFCTVHQGEATVWKN